MSSPNFSLIEQKLSDALDEWALRVPGIVLAQKNPMAFIQILRSFGFEIIPVGEVQKIRYEQKAIKFEVTQAYKVFLAAKTRLETLDQKEILNDPEPPKVEDPIKSAKATTRTKKDE
jgi:hypothetical protein